MTGQIGQSDRRPLSTVLRSQIDDDEELRRFRDELKSHVFRGIEWWDTDRRRAAIRRVRQLAPGVPRLIRPADLTIEKVAVAYATDPRTAHLQDAWSAIWAHRIEGRQAMVLARIFDQLRSGAAMAIARPCHNPTSPISIPKEIWEARISVVDTTTGDVLIDTTPAFIGVMFTPPAPRASLSESAARRFLTKLAEEMERAGRTFSSAEAAAALQRDYRNAPMASLRQVARLLRELRPGAWANGGRRPVFQVPSAAELQAAAEAARQAIETPS